MPILKEDNPKPCAFCPFREEALKGYLGPWSAKAIYDWVRRFPLACHNTMDRDVSKGEFLDPDADLSDMYVCRGSINHLKKCAVRHPHPEIKRMVDETDRAETDGILGGNFIPYHHNPVREATEKILRNDD